MRISRNPAAAAVLFFSAALCGCEALVVAGAAGGAYEYANRQALGDLEDSYRAGDITKQQYLERKDEIEKRSAVY